jgi:hypothetical protein
VSDEQQSRPEGEQFDGVTAEFIAAAARLADSVRPWVTAGAIEHAAHPEGEPGDCRFCAVASAVGGHWDSLAGELGTELGGFADRFRSDLQQLLQQVLTLVATAMSAMATDYEQKVGRSPSGFEDERPGRDVPGGPSEPSGDVGQTGFQRIEIRLEDPQ